MLQLLLFWRFSSDHKLTPKIEYIVHKKGRNSCTVGTEILSGRCNGKPLEAEEKTVVRSHDYLLDSKKIINYEATYWSRFFNNIKFD